MNHFHLKANQENHSFLQQFVSFKACFFPSSIWLSLYWYFSPFFIIWYCLFDLLLIGLRRKPMSLSCFNLIAICRLSGSTKKNQIKVVTENYQTPFTQLDNLDIKFRFTQLQNRPKYEYKDIGKGYHFSFPKLLSNVTVLYCLDSYLLVFSLFNI